MTVLRCPMSLFAAILWAVVVVVVMSSLVQADDRSALDFLNQARRANQLPVFQINSALFQAADNHARYMVASGASSHTEAEGSPGFTGTDCLERITTVGYPAALCSENLSSGEQSWRESAEGLMTAIYHRKGFLDFNMDEIGYAVRASSRSGNSQPKNYFSYLMGNSVRRAMCEQPSSPFGYGACTDSSKRIDAPQFEVGKDAVANRGGEFAIYPWAGQQEVWPHFDNVEEPNPLPGIQLTGQPVSIHFNPVRLQGKVVQIVDFRLFDPEEREVRLLPVKDQYSDPLFSEYDFAWFPELVLVWSTTYQVRMVYSVDGQVFHNDWSFTTADVPYQRREQGPRAGVVVVDPGMTALKLPRNKVYSLVLSPELSSSSICGYAAEYFGKFWIEKAAFNVINISVPDKATLTLTLCSGHKHQMVINGK